MKASLFRNLSERHCLIAIGLVLCLLCGAFLMADESDDLVNLYYQTGLENFKKGNYDQAVKKFQKALSYQKDFAPVLFKLGEVSEKLKDSKAAVKYYRLSLRTLESKDRLTEEEKDILKRTTSALGRLDKKKTEIEKVTTRFIDRLTILGKDCYKKKYHKFAYRCFERILLLDSEHPIALQYIKKIEPVPSIREKPEMIKEIRLFNKKNLRGWEISDKSLKTWKVKKGELIADASKSDSQQAVLMWKGKAPQNYTISVEYIIESTRGEQKGGVGFIYGRSQKEADKSFAIVAAGAPPDKWHKISLTKKGQRISFEVNGKVYESGRDISRLSITENTIGLSVSQARVRFRNIILKGLK